MSWRYFCKERCWFSQCVYKQTQTRRHTVYDPNGLIINNVNSALIPIEANSQNALDSNYIYYSDLARIYHGNTDFVAKRSSN